MVTQIDPISTPPTPADPPEVFEQKASQVWADLYVAVPQMNAQAEELTQAAQEVQEDAQATQQAKEAAEVAAANAASSANAQIAPNVQAAQQAAALAGQYSVAAQTAASEAGDFALTAGSSAGAAAQSQSAADSAAAVAAEHAASMGQAIAMAATFAAVPTTFQAWVIVVTQPHLRAMVWSAVLNKYVRAPWHQPCQLFYSYDNPASIPGALPVRADVNWNQADFPDVVGRLGLSGVGTFSLVEARGEFIRVLDNGRGVDVGRAIRSAQGDAIRDITGTFAGGEASGSPGSGAFNREGVSSSQNGNVYPQSFYSFAASRVVPVANENRPRNIAFPLWMTI